MVITIVMFAITFLLLWFFLKVWVYGDDTHFFVIGSWRIGLIGIGLSLISAVVMDILHGSLVLPGILFAVSLVFIYINSSPIIQVQGDNAVCTSFTRKVKFTKSDVAATRENKGLSLVVNGRRYNVYSDSINFDMLEEWLGISIECGKK